MSFLSQSILWGLFAVLLPVIIHLLNRRRFRTVKWAATTFLLTASRQSRGRKKLKHFLILACRVLAIAALVIAVARPIVGGFLGFSSGQVDTVILVLDRSASMETRPGSGQATHREWVLGQIADALEGMGSPRLLLIDSATEELVDVPSPEVLKTLSATQPTDTQANIPNLLTKAVEYLKVDQPSSSEIWLASDRQRGDWRPEDTRWTLIKTSLETLPNPTKLRVLSPGDDFIENTSLELVSSRRVDGELLLELKIIRANGGQPRTLPITYSLQGARFSERLTIDRDTFRFVKRLPVSQQIEKGHGWVSLPPDANNRDNGVFFTFGDEQATQNYVVVEDSRKEMAGYLQKAATPVSLRSEPAQIVLTSQLAQLNWDTASLVIWQAPLPDGAAAIELRNFVNQGGSALFFPPESPSKNSLFGMTWGTLEQAPSDQFFISNSWIKNDGPWQNGMEGDPLPVSQIRAIQRRSLIGDGTSLAEWSDQSPLLTRAISEAGAAFFINTLPDDRWSNLEFLALHLVAAQRLMESGKDRFHRERQAIAGTSSAILQANEERERLDDFEEHDASQGAFRAGVYRLGERLVAVNRPSPEGMPDQIDQETLDGLLEGVSLSLFASNDRDEDLVAEAWRLFLFAALLFLIAEALLSLQPRRINPQDRMKSKPSSVL